MRLYAGMGTFGGTTSRHVLLVRGTQGTNSSGATFIRTYSTVLTRLNSRSVSIDCLQDRDTSTTVGGYARAVVDRLDGRGPTLGTLDCNSDTVGVLFGASDVGSSGLGLSLLCAVSYCFGATLADSSSACAQCGGASGTGAFMGYFRKCAAFRVCTSGITGSCVSNIASNNTLGQAFTSVFCHRNIGGTRD